MTSVGWPIRPCMSTMEVAIVLVISVVLQLDVTTDPESVAVLQIVDSIVVTEAGEVDTSVETLVDSEFVVMVANSVAVGDVWHCDMMPQA